jgi:hypothetical protein
MEPRLTKYRNTSPLNLSQKKSVAGAGLPNLSGSSKKREQYKSRRRSLTPTLSRPSDTRDEFLGKIKT